MSNVPSELSYTKSHEWVKVLAGGGGGVEVGITEHAQHALGDLVFVELPETGRSVQAGDALAVVESVKAASDVYSPIAGTVTARNDALEATPELINQDPYGAGWMLRLEPLGGAALAGLLSASEYAAYLAAEGD